MNITVVYSIPTQRVIDSPYLMTEEDTKDSAIEVVEALKSKGADVTLIAVGEGTLDQLERITGDCIFNLIEWTGLDLPLAKGAIARMETLGIPITGATSAQYALTTDKIALKKALDVHHFPTALWQQFKTGDEDIRPDMPYPALVKPSLEHCSIGITKKSIVHNKKELRNVVKHQLGLFQQSVFAEQFISGDELQITLIEEEGNIRVLTPAQIIFDRHDKLSLLSYESRWHEHHPEFKASHVKLAKLHSQILSQLVAVCRKVYHTLGFRDYARFDVKVDNGVIYILEANSNPGLGHSEDYGMTVSYVADGLTFADFVWKIVQSCLRRSH